MPSRPNYRWDAIIQRYREANGRLVAEGAVRTALEAARAAAAREATALAEDFLARRLSRTAFRDAMHDLIRDTNLYHGAVAYGGFPSMTAEQFADVARRVELQDSFLDNMLQAYDRHRISGAQLRARATQYARSGVITYWSGRAVMEAVRSQRRRQERNVLGVGEHCVECVNLSNRGWVEIGTLKLPGSRICRANCKCHIAYRS